MAPSPVIPCKGLHTSDSPLSAVPVGSLAVAKNCVAQFEDVLEPMRGQGFVSNQVGADAEFSDITREGLWYRGHLVTHSDDGTISHVDESTSVVAEYSGTYVQPDPTLARMRFLEVQESLYFNTDVGVHVLESPTATPHRAGVSRVPMASASGVADAAGVVAPDAQVAHRVLWSRTDANDTEHVGPPSPRVVSVNHIARVAAGGMVRSGTTVTVTHTGSLPLSAPNIEISPGETNFPGGPKTITGTGSGTFTYTEAGTATSSTQAQRVLGTGMNVELDFIVPWDARPGDRFKVFRSHASAGADIPPDDEMFQSVEGVVPGPFVIPPGDASRSGSTVTLTIPGHGWPIGGLVRVSSADPNFNASGLRSPDVVDEDTVEYTDDWSPPPATNMSAVTVSFATCVVSDAQPQALLGAPLYTNPNTGDGAEAARFQPPICRDMCLWQGRSFFINTEDVHRFELTLLGADDIETGDEITIDGITYRANHTGETAFFPETGGTAGTNITATIASLARAICLHSSSNLVAYVDEDDVAIPGRITLERRIPGGAAFAVYASRPTSWAPALTTGSTGALTSKADRRKNGISFTPQGLHQAVPLPNFELVGPDGAEILRAVPSRDKLWVFLDNGRIYTVAGVGPFRIDEFDGTARLLSADSAVTHSNQIFCLSSQGVVSVSDAGVRILSKEIETELLPLVNRATRAAIRRHAFGVSYESDRQYILAIPTTVGTDGCDRQYVFNSATGRWTRWARNRTWGRVHPERDRLYMGEGLAPKIRVERKSYNRSDYCEEDLPRVATLSGGVISLNSVSGVSAGDGFYGSGVGSAIVTEITGTAITLSGPVTLVEGVPTNVYINVAFECDVKWRPAVPSGPNVETHFAAALLHFGRYVVHTAHAHFDTDYSVSEADVELAPRNYVTDFGDIYDNEPDTSPKSRRVEVPPEKGTATQLRVGFRVREAFASWSLHGYSLDSTRGGERTDY